MTPVFADTFYWIALTNFRDVDHKRAKALTFSARPTSIVTTEEVLMEYLNYFAGWGVSLRRKALSNARHIMGSRTVKVVSQTAASFRNGLDLYGARLDKGYSMTDCISMQTMRTEGITDVLTNDVPFEQEGFRTLFRES